MCREAFLLIRTAHYHQAHTMRELRRSPGVRRQALLKPICSPGPPSTEMRSSSPHPGRAGRRTEQLSRASHVLQELVSLRGISSWILLDLLKIFIITENICRNDIKWREWARVRGRQGGLKEAETELQDLGAAEGGCRGSCCCSRKPLGGESPGIRSLGLKKWLRKEQQLRRGWWL